MNKLRIAIYSKTYTTIQREKIIGSQYFSILFVGVTTVNLVTYF
jgi:hypothetical protein